MGKSIEYSEFQNQEYIVIALGVDQKLLGWYTYFNSFFSIVLEALIINIMMFNINILYLKK